MPCLINGVARTHELSLDIQRLVQFDPLSLETYPLASSVLTELILSQYHLDASRLYYV